MMKRNAKPLWRSSELRDRLKGLDHWLEQRSLSYAANRALRLLQRYGVTSSRAKNRARACVALLARYNCFPSFPTPGRVVARNGAFCRELQEMGAELTVHGFDHVDFRSLSREEARAQFVRAADAFRGSGVDFSGFRCPYLSYSEGLGDVIKDVAAYRGTYSSNKAIRWDVAPSTSGNTAHAIFTSLEGFYRAAPASTVPVVPTFSGELLEIPVSVPDDIQLLDGLKLSEAELADVWKTILAQTHERGEVFVLLFHPETFDACPGAFEAVLERAQQLEPRVWLTQLRDVNRWWREKAAFSVRVEEHPEPRLVFDCTARATVLVRHFGTAAPLRPWHGAYKRLEARTLALRGDTLPLLGLAPDVPAETEAFLKEQGFVTVTGEQAARCALLLDRQRLERAQTPLELLEQLDTSPEPLVRFWRWPDGARSALCVTGDLDALSLLDYAGRLVAR